MQISICLPNYWPANEMPNFLWLQALVKQLWLFFANDCTPPFKWSRIHLARDSYPNKVVHSSDGGVQTWQAFFQRFHHIGICLAVTISTTHDMVDQWLWKTGKIENLISKLNFYKLIPYPMDNCFTGRRDRSRQMPEKDVLYIILTGPVTECAFARRLLVLPSCLDSVTS